MRKLTGLVLAVLLTAAALMLAGCPKDDGMMDARPAHERVQAIG